MDGYFLIPSYDIYYMNMAGHVFSLCFPPCHTSLSPLSANESNHEKAYSVLTVQAGTQRGLPINIDTVTLVYFSPVGTTRKIVKGIPGGRSQ